MEQQKSKFAAPKKKITLKKLLIEIKYTILFWKGRSKGMIHTRNLKLSDIRYIFFPKDFTEKYGYLGATIPSSGELFQALYPLVLALDFQAKPSWCPRWFLRFLHVFGNDKSIVRVRNFRLHLLFRKITQGVLFWDWKTKWYSYDLRISVSGSRHLQNLASAIEHDFFKRGYTEELKSKIKKLDPEAKIIMTDIKSLERMLNDLEKKNEQ